MTHHELRRPQTLADVAEIARRNSSDFAMALDEFVDEFYLDHPDKIAQQKGLDAVSPCVDDPVTDAWIGAASSIWRNDGIKGAELDQAVLSLRSSKACFSSGQYRSSWHRHR